MEIELLTWVLKSISIMTKGVFALSFSLRQFDTYIDTVHSPLVANQGCTKISALDDSGGAAASIWFISGLGAARNMLPCTVSITLLHFCWLVL